MDGLDNTRMKITDNGRVWHNMVQNVPIEPIMSFHGRMSRIAQYGKICARII
jgi:hypothetical protein